MKTEKKHKRIKSDETSCSQQDEP